MAKISTMHFEIRDALKTADECFLCVLERNLDEKYAEHYLYEQVMDPESRAAIVASRGFCNYHFYALLREARKPDGTDGQGLALIMESITQALISDIEEQRGLRGIVGPTESRAARLNFILREIKSHLVHPSKEKHLVFEESARKMFSLRESCPACSHVYRFISIYLGDFIEELNNGNQEIVELFKASKGLCMPHYAAIMYSIDEKLAESRKGVVAQQVIEVQLQNIERLNAELAEYGRKQDYRFSHEPWGTEKDAVPRGVAKLAGMMGVKTTTELDCKLFWS